MHVAELELEEFRSYRRLRLPLEAAGLRLIGDNASGKSTLLEAIAMLATTRSNRTSAERDVIHWESGESLAVPPYARLRGVVRRADRTSEIEIGMQIDPHRMTHVKKQIRLNGRPVRALDAVGTLNAVLFSPEDIDLVSGSPGGRRRYLDLTISQLDGSYLRSLARFSRILDQRNSLLKSLAKTRAGARSSSVSEQLAFWDAELIAHGSAVIARRLLTVGRLTALTAKRFEQLAARGDLVLGYESTVSVPDGQRDDKHTMDDLQGVVARNYGTLLDESRGNELQRGMTLVGPHRDDLTFRLGELDIGRFGSRGQQRLVVVALKLAITTLMTEVAGEPPVLMLDDVLSELDQQHRAWLLRTAAGSGTQVIVTSTDAASLSRPELLGIPAARVIGGTIEPITLA